MSSGTPSIADIAGTGHRGFSGDGGVAVKARLDVPVGVAEDAAGNLYLADSANDRIRKVVSPTTINSDIITTIAGQKGSGFSGDGGPATQALLDHPSGVAVDAMGDVFVADSGNDRVRKIDAGGTITTIAGNGSCGDRSSLGDGGPATAASLCDPTGIAVNSAGDVFIADSGHNLVREVLPTGTITTFAGTGHRGLTGDGGPATMAELDDPTGLAVDALGNVYIADTGNDEVRIVNAKGVIDDFAGVGDPKHGGGLRLDAHDGRGFDPDGWFLPGGGRGLARGLRGLAGENRGEDRNTQGHGRAGDPPAGLGDGGPATDAHLSFPTGVTVDPSGNVFIADTGDDLVREVSGGTITTYAGSGRFGRSGNGGPATSAALRSPTGIVADGAAVYFADTGNNEIRGVFTGPPPTLPETPFLIALPVAAILIGGAGYLIVRRRAAAAS